MKQIVVISGKGGTGKTVITAALAAVSENALFVDCDVDASNLHLLLAPAIKETRVFKSGKTAFILAEKCTHCGLCASLCRFQAIDEARAVVDPISCEGCGFCAEACPHTAIQMRENTTGEYYESQTRFGRLVHAELGAGEENSGKLVFTVRTRATELAKEQGCELVLIDGSPGIGCPVIASLTGTDYALVVVEPTVSGIHDAERVVQVARHFKVPAAVIINKCDINPEMSERIRLWCAKEMIQCMAEIPFDEEVVHAVSAGVTIMEYEKTRVKEQIRELWRAIEKTIINTQE
jgi:MinD superfamily P-loop ATPase